MPELPEIQAHAERLDERVRRRGARRLPAADLHRAEDRCPRPGRRLRPAARRVGRRGKYLLLASATPRSSSTSCRAAG